MELKSKRHAYLTDLLSRSSLKRQDEVVREMMAKGFDVTQSSISRDFKELGVIKIGGVYKPGKMRSEFSERSPLQMMIRKVDTAGPHLVVVLTTPGAAAAVAEEIDLGSIDGVVGTVAGDNTIMIATKSAAAQARAIIKIQNI